MRRGSSWLQCQRKAAISGCLAAGVFILLNLLVSTKRLTVVKRTQQSVAFDLRVLKSALVATGEQDPAAAVVRFKPLPAKSERPGLFATPEYEQALQASLREPKGRCPRLNSTRDEPFGLPPEINPLCPALRQKGVTRVAIVGNGPISAADRLAIERCDLVIRFNLLNNWQRYKEKIDIWVVRYSVEAAAGYWGINNIQPEEIHRIVTSVKGVWMVGGAQAVSDRQMTHFPELADHGPVLLPEPPLNAGLSRELGDPDAFPTTGFVTLMAVTFCNPTAQIHVFGMNWSSQMWFGHRPGAEAEYVEALVSQGRVVLHPGGFQTSKSSVQKPKKFAAACDGMRECGPGDIDNSCHWSRQGAYLCLLGDDGSKRWLDMTAKVLPERRKEYATDVSGASKQQA